jgi:hypothetical protein
LPPSCSIKPKPFESLNHFTVPSTILNYSLLCAAPLEPLYLIMPVNENINRLVALVFIQKNRTPSFWGLCG